KMTGCDFPNLWKFVYTWRIHSSLYHKLFHCGILLHAFLKLLPHIFPCACKFFMTESVHSRRVVKKHLTSRILHALGNNDYISPCLHIAAHDPVAINGFHIVVDDIKVHRDFRYQYAVGFSSDPAMQRGMSDISAEYFYSQDTVVAETCGFQFPCKKSDPVNRGIASHAVRLEIEVHSLGDMHAGYALGAEVHDNASGVVATAYNQGVYAEFPESFF